MGGIDRRMAMLGAAGVAASVGVSAHAAGDPLSGEALYADVKAYSDLGEHRTGTPGDAATTGWMLSALQRAGYLAETQGFDYPVFEVGRTDIRQGFDNFWSGFPYWTPKPTGPKGVTGPLSLTAGPGRISLVTLPPGAGAGLNAPPPVEITRALAAGSVAVIAVTDNPLGEMTALNRTPKAPAWPAPVILVDRRFKGWVPEGEALTVFSEGRMVQGRAHNVVARKPGRGKAVVVSTPKSGWFHCAGERGSGIAIWLGLARWLAATDMNVVLVAASGHEFDGYGGARFAETLAPRPADTRLWVAIGANVAGYDFGLVDGKITRRAGPPSARILACSEALLPVAARAFAGQPGYEKPSDIEKQKPPGEVAHFQELGYSPLVGMVAASPLHHTRRDLPDVTGPAVLEPVARGLAAIIAAA